MGLSLSKRRRPPPPSSDQPPPLSSHLSPPPSLELSPESPPPSPDVSPPPSPDLLAPSRLWELPPDLIGFILFRLLSHADRLTLRAVCRQWRLAVHQQMKPTSEPNLPWIRLRTTDGGFTFHLQAGKLHRCVRAVNVLDPSRAAMLRSSGDDGWLELFNPGDTYYMCNTSSGAIVRLPRVPARLCVKSSEFGCAGGGKEKEIPSWSFIRKVMVCSPDDLIAAMLYENAVGFYRPGGTSWSVHPAPECNDIAFYRGKLYSVTDDESLFAHELVHGSDDTVSHVVEQVIRASPNRDERRHFPRMLYLVASCDRLLMVAKWIVPRRAVSSIRKNTAEEGDGAIRLKVFEADLEMGRWMEVNNGLDGHAIFASRSCSKLVRLSGHDQRFQGDRVYFPGCENPKYRTTEYSGDDSPSYRFYDTRENTMTKVFLNKGDVKYQSYPEWFFPSPQQLCLCM